MTILSIETLRKRQAEEIARLEREHEIVSRLPAPPDFVHDGRQSTI